MNLFDVLKLVTKALKEAGKIDLRNQMLDVQEKLLEMQEKIRVQDNEIRDLKEKLKIKGDIFFKKNACWIKKKDGSKDGPFCSGCWDNADKKQLIHLHQWTANAWHCPVCKVHVEIESYHENKNMDPHIIPRDEKTW
jgi:hypothetical protein